MKFLIDANLPYSVKELLSVHGTTWHLRDLKMEAATDAEVIVAAKRRSAILVTRDLEFGNPLVYPPRLHCGVVILRCPSNFRVQEILELLRYGFEEIDVDELANAITVIEPRKIRIRRSL